MVTDRNAFFCVVVVVVVVVVCGCNAHLKKRGTGEHYLFGCKIKFYRKIGEIPTQCPFKNAIYVLDI